jgi:hypothetical protein
MGHEDHLLPPKLSARSVIRRADRRRDMRQWARRAESRHFIFRAGASEDPHHRPFSDLITGSNSHFGAAYQTVGERLRQMTCS